MNKHHKRKRIDSIGNRHKLPQQEKQENEKLCTNMISDSEPNVIDKKGSPKKIAIVIIIEDCDYTDFKSV